MAKVYYNYDQLKGVLEGKSENVSRRIARIFKKGSVERKAIEKIESRFKVIQYTHQPFTNTEYERARLLIFD